MKGSAFILVLAACGGSSVPNRAAVSGKVEGTPLVTTNAVAFAVNGGVPTVDVLISNQADGCGANASDLKSKQVLSLGITSLAGQSLATGDFGVYDQNSGSIPQGIVVFADYHSSNDACGDTTPPNTIGASGHVTVTKLSVAAGGSVQGSFDLLLQNGDRLKGTFDAPVCQSGGADAGAGTCH
jgi:hypothetical protein